MFATFSLLVWSLPSGLQECVQDVSEVYHNIPLHASQWPSIVVRMQNDDAFTVDTQAGFGEASFPGQFGYVFNGALDILHATGIGPVLH